MASVSKMPVPEVILVAESPRKPRTSPLMSPKMPMRSMSRSFGNENERYSAGAPVAATFEVKFKGNKTYTVNTRVDLGPNIQDEARFRDTVADVSWADLEAFSREVAVAIPPGVHILLPALRCGLIRRWIELVVAERGLSSVLLFLHADDVVRFPARLNRVFSRALEEPGDDLIHL